MRNALIRNLITLSALIMTPLAAVLASSVLLELVNQNRIIGGVATIAVLISCLVFISWLQADDHPKNV